MIPPRQILSGLAAMLLATTPFAVPAGAQSAKATPKTSKPAAKAPKAVAKRPAALNQAASAKPDPGASHESLVMAYRDNLVMFTKKLRGNGAGPVDVVVARPAMEEMKHSYEQLMKHHDAQLDDLSSRVDGPAASVKSQMDARLARIGTQLAALDLVVNDPTPDPREVASRSAAILKECAALTPLRAKATR